MVNNISKIFPGIIKEDFIPVNDWTLDERTNAPKLYNGEPQLVFDSTSKRGYLNDSQGTVRFKCALLTLGTPIVHGIASVINLVYRIVKFVSGYHFWCKVKGEENYDFKARALRATGDLSRMIAAPLTPIALVFSAMYGLIRPYDGRKLYATIERMQYGQHILAPCFQPDPRVHLFGSNIRQPNAM